MKGLIIAYKFSPEGTVGALRPSYWAEEMERQHGIKIDVITATDGPSCEEYVRFVVPDSAKSFLSLLIKDEGLTWKKNLTKFLRNKDLSDYDFAIITGGPFFHFSIAKQLRSYGLKVILDFRDPFSYNPRFGEKGLKKFIKQRFERSCINNADLVLTVNKECHEYIGGDLKVKRGVLPNGYDDRIEISKKGSIETDVFYAGKFYWEPSEFFDVLESERLSLTHAGNEHVSEHSFVKSSLFRELGFLDQKTLYGELSKAEIGVVFTMDVPFESTTKIYDYIALNKKILVVTQGTPNVGALKRELDKYPLHKWVNNNQQDILQALIELKQQDAVPCDVESFSRRSGLKKLVEYIKELVE
jgi:hypothetical protein